MENEKTYKFLNHDTPIPLEEIRKLYDGYWVYMVNVERDEFNGIIRAIPVIAGVRPHDGAFDGIYDKYRADEYMPTGGKSFLRNRFFISSLRWSSDANV